MNGALIAISDQQKLFELKLSRLGRKARPLILTIQSISIDVTKIGHGMSKTRESLSSLYCPHKLKITLQCKSEIRAEGVRERERERK